MVIMKEVMAKFVTKFDAPSSFLGDSTTSPKKKIAEGKLGRIPWFVALRG
jgi:hypothetical protein